MLKELDDVALDSTTLSNGDELVYDATDRKWKNAVGSLLMPPVRPIAPSLYR